MSLRKLDGGGAACAYCGFALVMEGDRQCCPAGRDYDALKRELEAQAREIERLEIERDNAIAAALQNKELVEWNRARLATAERERDEAVEYGTRTRREWQRECEDTNLMLQGLGLCPSEYRSEGGSLMLGRIQHAFKKREASIVAERDEAVALLREAQKNYRCGWCGAAVFMTTVDRIDSFLAKLEAKP